MSSLRSRVLGGWGWGKWRIVGGQVGEILWVIIAFPILGYMLYAGERRASPLDPRQNGQNPARNDKTHPRDSRTIFAASTITPHSVL